MYEKSWMKCIEQTDEVHYKGAPLYYFANGYNEAIKNIQKYGIKRVKRNAQSGIAV